MRILINRTDAIGDTILTMPMASMIKKAFPAAEVAFLISPIAKSLFDYHETIDRHYVIKKDGMLSTYKQFVAAIDDFQPDYYFYVGGSHLGSMAAFMRRVKVRGGLLSRLPSFLYLNKGVRQKRSYVEMHEAEYNLNLLKGMGLRYDYQDYCSYRSGIKLSSREISEAKDEFEQMLLKSNKKFSWDKKIVFIHPGMTGHTLNWPSRNYGNLVTYLNKKKGSELFFIISHTPSDDRYVKAVRDELEDSFRTTDLFSHVYFFDGSQKGLRNYMAVLSLADVFVGPSTGTTHLANALGIKTVGIYSPIKVQSALRWRPLYPKDLDIVTPDVICGEAHHCIMSECPYYECMSKIDAKEVGSLVLQKVGEISNDKCDRTEAL